jgi:hypothetical protein
LKLQGEYIFDFGLRNSDCEFSGLESELS